MGKVRANVIGLGGFHAAGHPAHAVGGTHVVCQGSRAQIVVGDVVFLGGLEHGEAQGVLESAHEGQRIEVEALVARSLNTNRAQGTVGGGDGWIGHKGYLRVWRGGADLVDVAAQGVFVLAPGGIDEEGRLGGVIGADLNEDILGFGSDCPSRDGVIDLFI